MKRIRRIILNALTGVSLILCIAFCILWARSYYVADIVWHKQIWTMRREDVVEVRLVITRLASHEGRLVVAQNREDERGQFENDSSYFNQWDWSHDIRRVPIYNDSPWKRMGLFYEYIRPSRLGWTTNADMRSVGIPFWLATTLASVLPLRALVFILRHLQAKPVGHCLFCGYDL